MFAIASAASCQSDGPDGVVRRYMRFSKWEDRVPLVLDGAKVASKMSAHYGNEDLSPKFTALALRGTCDSSTPVCIVHVQFEGEDDADYVVEHTQAGWKIDWEASVGYNEISAEAFRAQRPTTPIRLLVWASLTDYYNFEFSDAQKTWYSVKLTDSNRSALPYGYVERSTADGTAIFELLKDGKDHQLVANIGFLPEPLSQGGNTAFLYPLRFGTWRTRALTESERKTTIENVVAHFATVFRRNTLAMIKEATRLRGNLELIPNFDKLMEAKLASSVESMRKRQLDMELKLSDPIFLAAQGSRGESIKSLRRVQLSAYMKAESVAALGCIDDAKAETAIPECLTKIDDPIVDAERIVRKRR